jgi:hypothetical protein
MFTPNVRICQTCGVSNSLKGHQRTRENPTPTCVGCKSKLFSSVTLLCPPKKKCVLGTNNNFADGRNYH